MRRNIKGHLVEIHDQNLIISSNYYSNCSLCDESFKPGETYANVFFIKDIDEYYFCKKLERVHQDCIKEIPVERSEQKKFFQALIDSF